MCVLPLALEAKKQDKRGERRRVGKEMLKTFIQYRQTKPQHLRAVVSPMEKTKLREGERPAQSHTAMLSVSGVETFPPTGASELAYDPGGSRHCPRKWWRVALG